MAIKHHNHEYDGGSPDIPLALGDRYYSQDLGRDFHYLRNLVGQILADLGQTLPALVSGGVVTKGTGDTLDITPAVGYVKHEVDLPDAFSSIPPAVIQEDIVLRAASPQQTNMAVPGATLNGSMVNYVKLRYAEVNGDSRARAKKAGSYYYEQSAGFSIVVNPTANTDYDVLLATFTGTGGGAFVITQVDPELKIKDYMLDFGTGAGQVGAEDLPIEDADGLFTASETELALKELMANVKASKLAGEAITAGDPVGYLDGEYKKMKIVQMELLAYADSSLDAADIQRNPVDPSIFIMLATDSSDIIVRVGQFTGGGVSWLCSESVVASVNPPNMAVAWLTGGAGYDFAVVYTATNSYVRVGRYATGSISWLTAATQIAASTIAGGVIGWEGAGADGRFIVYYGTNSTAFVRVGEEAAGSVSWVTSALALTASHGLNLNVNVIVESIAYIGGNYLCLLTRFSDNEIWVRPATFDGATTISFFSQEQTLQIDIGETATQYYHQLFRRSPFKLYASWVTAGVGERKYSVWLQELEYPSPEDGRMPWQGPSYKHAKRLLSYPTNLGGLNGMGVFHDGIEVTGAGIDDGLLFMGYESLVWFDPDVGTWGNKSAPEVIGADGDLVIWAGDIGGADKILTVGKPVFVGVALNSVSQDQQVKLALPGAVIPWAGGPNGRYYVNMNTGAIELGGASNARHFPVGRVVDEKLYVDLR